MSGEARGSGATILRCAMSIAEPFYATAMRLRNWGYTSGLYTAHRLGIPVISVGNITTGGTGKTPVVIWLARELSARGKRPAVLLRGYKSGDGCASDEQLVLESALAGVAAVAADPDRVSAGRRLLESGRQIDVILLDDGLQHRRLARDFELVLIDATNPFGFDHVLPRGLLREPLIGLARASAFLLTRANQVAPAVVQTIEHAVKRRNPRAPIYQCSHVLPEMISADGQVVPVEQASSRKLFLFCGIGNPKAIIDQLTRSGLKVAGSRAFADHHRYTAHDPRILERAALDAGADWLITTEKDWVKFAPLAKAVQMPIFRAALKLEFAQGDDARLLAQIEEMLARWVIATRSLPGPRASSEVSG